MKLFGLLLRAGVKIHIVPAERQVNPASYIELGSGSGGICLTRPNEAVIHFNEILPHNAFDFDEPFALCPR